jgi:transcriptional regulator with XRE-family HTH domain
MQLKDYLKLKKKTVTSLAQELSIGRPTLSRYLHGRAKTPLFIKLAVAYLSKGKVRPHDWTD